MVFIEEPEAHLHPQMQEVFISKLSEIAEIFAKSYNEGRPWPVQFVVTTHSPHIANQAPFDATRYFVAIPEPKPAPKSGTAETQACAGDSCTTKIKDLGAGSTGMKKQDRDFLHQYMTLTKCDLFFADKAVLIEGTTERLMLPVMVKKVEAKQSSSERKLSSQYVSVVEVGGAYAHRFYDLLDFLELRTLVITDLDSVDKDSKGEACKVSVGVKSSNACVNNWFGPKNLSPAELILKSDADKTMPLRRLAYQVPEVSGGPCGRSFEAAFKLANPSLFALDGTDVQKEDAAWDTTQNIKKTAFALKHAIDETDWIVPRYIAEGLRWLAEGPSCGMTNAVNPVSNDGAPGASAEPTS
jgi:Predicted ATP-dependent endonuclease of the OLD family